jgi:hypothetical protein
VTWAEPHGVNAGTSDVWTDGALAGGEYDGKPGAS